MKSAREKVDIESLRLWRFIERAAREVSRWPRWMVGKADPVAKPKRGKS